MRYNGFDFIHRALRGMLYDAAITLQKTDFTVPAEVDNAFEKITNVLWMYERHAHHENTFILPAIEKFESKSCSRFFNDHEEDHRLSEGLKELMKRFRNSHEALSKAEAASEFKLCFNDFIAFNLNHMNAEERILNEAMWKHYTDEELLAINGELRKAIPEEEAMFSVKWMFNSLNKQEVRMMLGMLKKSVPEPIFQKLLSYVKSNSILEEAELQV